MPLKFVFPSFFDVRVSIITSKFLRFGVTILLKLKPMQVIRQDIYSTRSFITQYRGMSINFMEHVREKIDLFSVPLIY